MLRLENRKLTDLFQGACKPRSHWRIGLESEFLCFGENGRLPYTGSPGITDLLSSFYVRYGGELVTEKGAVLGWRGAHYSLSLEPGAQMEFASEPVSNLHDLADLLRDFWEKMEVCAQAHKTRFYFGGIDPVTPFRDVMWIPKQRYQVMRLYMAEKGRLGPLMMSQTCTSQVNLDIESESHGMRALRLSLILQPFITALFSASPLFEGRVSGYESVRSLCWQHLDADRTGLPAFACTRAASFQDYTDYLLDVPMYGIMRGQSFIPGVGQVFRNFLKQSNQNSYQKLNQCDARKNLDRPRKKGDANESESLSAFLDMASHRPRWEDWVYHAATVFPEVRLHPYLEMRGADGTTPDLSLALAALWTGWLYDHESFQNLERALEGRLLDEGKASSGENINIIYPSFKNKGIFYGRDRDREQMRETEGVMSCEKELGREKSDIFENGQDLYRAVDALWRSVSMRGMSSLFCGWSLWTWWENVLLPHALIGLKNRGFDEAVFLAPLQNMLTLRQTRSQYLCAHWRSSQSPLDFLEKTGVRDPASFLK